MKNKLLTLVKMQLIATYGGIFSKGFFKQKENQKKLGTFILICFCMLPLLSVYIIFLNAIFSMTSALNQNGLILSFGVIGVSFVILFFSFMYTFTAFFISRDIEMMLTYPIKPSDIILSKLICILIAEYAFALPMLAPLFIINAIHSTVSVWYILFAIISTLLIPLIPICISAIISILIVRLFGMKVNAEKIQGVFTLVSLFLVIGMNLLFNNSSFQDTVADPNGLIASLMNDKFFLINQLASVYYPSKLVSSALVGGGSFIGIINMLGFILISALATYICVFLANKLYLSAVGLGLKSAGKSKRLMTKDEMDKSFKQSTKKWFVIMKYDFRVIIRTPIFAYNTLLMLPLMPLIMGISMSSSLGNMQVEIAQFFSSNPEVVSQIVTIALIFIGGFCITTSTSFSREGRAFWINQIAPISANDQLIGRSLVYLILNAIVNIIILSLMVILLSFPVGYALMCLICTTSFIIPATIMGLCVDAKKPKLDWDDPAMAMKKNTTPLLAMLFVLLYILVVGLLALLMNKFHIPAIVIMLVFTVLNVVLSVKLKSMFNDYYNRLLYLE